MTSTAFTAVTARGVLPFEKAPSGGWSKFGLEDAIRLALFMDLTARGLSQGQASSLLRHEFNALLDFLNAEPAPPPGPLFFGQATFGEYCKGQSEPSHEVAAVVCAIEGNIDEAIANARRGLRGRWEMTGLTLVSASGSMGRILPRLIHLGLATPEVYNWAAFMRAPGVNQSWRKGQ